MFDHHVNLILPTTTSSKTKGQITQAEKRIKIVENPFSTHYCGKRGGLMVNMFDSRSSGPSSSTGWGQIVLCSWARHFTLTLPLELHPGV